MCIPNVNFIVFIFPPTGKPIIPFCLSYLITIIWAYTPEGGTLYSSPFSLSYKVMLGAVSCPFPFVLNCPTNSLGSSSTWGEIREKLALETVH